MQTTVKKLKADGLTHEFSVTVSSATIDEKMNQRLAQLSKTVKMAGFRPGKVPLEMVKKRHGQAVLGEVIEDVIQESWQKALDEAKLKPALRPSVNIKSFAEGKDLEYEMKIEVLPEMKLPDLKKLEIERWVAEIDEEEIKKTISQLAEQHQSSAPIKGDRASKTGDILIIDFVGKVDGEAFEGGSATHYSLKLGSNSFIDTFEDQLTGKKKGDEVLVKVTFPAEYHAPNLAGQPATFDVKIHDIHEPSEAKLDDELAKKMGFDNFAALEGAVREHLGREYEQNTRTRLKRDLFDTMADQIKCDLPPSLVASEIENIHRMFHRHDHDHKDGEDCSHDTEKFRPIAERRVKLGLLLAEIGQSNNIEVTSQELQMGLMREAQNYPGQEQKVVEFYQKNPQALENIRAPILEEKVVDFVIGQAKVKDKKVTKEELFAPHPNDEMWKNLDDSSDESGKAKAKKASSSKAKASESKGESKGEAKTTKKTAAKKAPAKKTTKKS